MLNWKDIKSTKDDANFIVDTTKGQQILQVTKLDRMNTMFYQNDNNKNNL